MTETNIDSTICVVGYSAKVRPPISVTEPIKRAEMRSYGLSEPLSLVELDHLVPLSLGGAPAAVANLWPENWDGLDGAHVKDTLELRLHALVCAHEVGLAVAQKAIATDWRSAYMQYVGSVVAATGRSE